MNEFLFVANNSLAFLVAFLASEICLRGRDGWRRFLAGAAGFPVVAVVTVLILGMLGKLSGEGAFVFLVLVTLGLAILHRRQGRCDKGLVVNAEPDGKARLNEKIVIFIGLVLLGGLAGLAVGRFMLPGVKYTSDDLSYHAPIVTQWLVNGHLYGTYIKMGGYYPFNSEVFALWFMLPFHRDGWVSLAGFYWLILAVVSVAALGLSSGNTKRMILLGAILAVTSPVVQNATRTFCGVDFAGPSMLLAGMVMVLPGEKEGASRRRLAEGWYGGLFLGFAAGCKVIYSPIVIVLGLWLLFGRGRGNFGVGIRIAGIFILGALMTGGFWYIRNLIVTGNPVFPAEAGPFKGPLTLEVQNRTRMISWIWAAPADWDQWKYLIKSHLNWPITFFGLSAVGYLAGIYRAVRTKAFNNNAARESCWLLLLVGLILMVLYPLMPFSGTTNSAEGKLYVRLRYAIGPFLLGLVLFSQVMDQRGIRGWIWWVLGALTAVVIFDNSGRFYFKSSVLHGVVIGMGFLGLYLGSRIVRSHLPGLAGGRVLFVFVPVVLTILSFCAPYQQRLNDRRIHEYGKRQQRPIGGVWEYLENLPAGSRIGWFGHMTNQYYPIFGREFQLVPCRIDADGKLIRPLHERWRENRENVKWWQKKGMTEPDILPDNLRAVNLEYILVTKWNRNDWPEQYEVLAVSEGLRKVYDDGYSVIWELER